MKKGILLVLMIIFVVYFAFTTHYGNKNPVAEVVSVKGQVTARYVDATVFSVPAVGQQLYGGTHIRTYERSCTELAMAEDVGQIELGENTYLELRPLSERELKQLNGIVVYRINKQGRDLRIHTPSGMASVLGTVFRVNVTASATEICVKEGRVAFVSSDGDRFIIDGGHEYATDNPENLVETVSMEMLNSMFVEPGSIPCEPTASATNSLNRLPESEESVDVNETIASPTLSSNEDNTLNQTDEEAADPASQFSSPETHIESPELSPRDLLQQMNIEAPKED
jgi:hypothetical protein